MSSYVRSFDAAVRYCPRLIAAALLIGLVGCAKAARDTTGFAVTETVVVEVPFDSAWQYTLDVLQEEDVVIYTRDTRGLFLAFTNPKRRFFVPQRHQYTVVLEPISSSATRVTVETQLQKFGVTLLTDPAWHDRPTEDTGRAEALVAALEARANEGLPAAS